MQDANQYAKKQFKGEELPPPVHWLCFPLCCLAMH